MAGGEGERMGRREHRVTIHEVATIGGVPFEMLRWEKIPGESASRIDFVVKGTHLYVSQNINAAVYVWSGSQVDLAWIATSNLDYFCSKCVASPLGAIPRDWDRHACLKRFREQVHAEHIQNVDAWPEHLLKTTSTSESEGEIETQVQEFWDRRLQESGIESATYTEYEWLQWLEGASAVREFTEQESQTYGEYPLNGELFLGDDWKHTHCDGRVVADIVRIHHNALKSALEWEKENRCRLSTT